MLDRCEMLRVLNALPWPPDKKPALAAGPTPAGNYVVNLHEPMNRGYADIAKIEGPTPERCLAFAIERWITVKGLNNDPRFYDAIRRLTN